MKTSRAFPVALALMVAACSADPPFPWAPNKANVKAFADAKGCVVKY